MAFYSIEPLFFYFCGMSMDWLFVFDYLFWLPIVFWLGFIFYSRYMAYPIALKKLLRKGEVWVYIPQWWKTKKAFWARFFSVFLAILTVMLSTITICWGLRFFAPNHTFLGFVFFPVFVLLSVLVFRKASQFVFTLQRSTFFLFYKRLLHNSQKEGLVMKDADLRLRSSWELQKTLLRAEKSGKLLRYLLAASQTKKIPKDLYAEALR